MLFAQAIAVTVAPAAVGGMGLDQLPAGFSIQIIGQPGPAPGPGPLAIEAGLHRQIMGPIDRQRPVPQGRQPRPRASVSQG